MLSQDMNVVAAFGACRATVSHAARARAQCAPCLRLSAGASGLHGVPLNSCSHPHGLILTEATHVVDTVHGNARRRSAAGHAQPVRQPDPAEPRHCCAGRQHLRPWVSSACACCASLCATQLLASPAHLLVKHRWLHMGSLPVSLVVRSQLLAMLRQHTEIITCSSV